MERVEGYMKRAEELRDYVNKQNELGKTSSGGTASKKKGEGGGDDDADEEKNKLRGALSGAIVTEKPDVKWDDVAGLEGAKDSLKEVRWIREFLYIFASLFIVFFLTFFINAY